jgi:5-methylcytosine-specific restriction endonuclease McrA
MSNTYRRRRLHRLYAENPRCWFCGLGFPPFPLNSERDRRQAEPTVEHLLPRSKGGTHRRGNIVLAHWFCNNLAGDRTPEEKRAIRERLHAVIAARTDQGQPPAG